MGNKQADRSRAKKAQRRKQKVLAAKRSGQPRPAGTLAHGEEDFDEIDDFTIGPDDYLPSGQVKASAALLMIAGPLCQQAGVRVGRDFEALLTMVMVGWNAEVAAAAHAPPVMLKKAREVLPQDARAEFDEIIAFVRSAKRAFFPDDQRLLVNLNVEDRATGPYVTVSSTEMPHNR